MADDTKGEVATKEEAKAPALMDTLVEAGQDYSQSMGQDDRSIPFIQILQSLSPQCDKQKPEYIKEAEPSMLFNTVTKELYTTQNDKNEPVEGMRVIHLFYLAQYIEWVPRQKGGGFVAQYDVPTGAGIQTFRNDNNHDIIAEGSEHGTPGNQLAYTHTHFVLVVKPDGDVTPAVLTMASTSIKPSKDWNALIDEVKLPGGQRAPTFYAVWSVSTRPRSNEQGSWYVWNFERAVDDGKPVDITQLNNAESLIQQCKDFIDGIRAGQHKADHAKASEASGGTPDENPEVKSTEKDDDTPF